MISVAFLAKRTGGIFVWWSARNNSSCLQFIGVTILLRFASVLNVAKSLELREAVEFPLLPVSSVIDMHAVNDYFFCLTILQALPDFLSVL